VLRLLGAILFLIGLILVLTIVGWFIGVWFMLFGVIMLVFGGGRRVVVHYRDRPSRREKVAKAKAPAAPPALAAARPLRDDAADDFSSAVMLYQKHTGLSAPGDAIRMLATDALRREGFLR